VSQLGKSALWMGLWAAAAGGLVLYAWYGVKAPQERAEKKKAAAERLVSFGGPEGEGPEPELTRVVLESGDDSTTVELQPSGTWRIVAPVVAPVDMFHMDSVVSQLSSGRMKGIVDEAPDEEALVRYGLSPPAFVVRATAQPKGGGEPREFVLRGGAENSFDGSVYLQRDDDPRVYAVQGGVRFGLEKTTYDLRHKELMEVDKSVRHVEVSAPTFRYVLEREGEDGESRWRITRPAPLAADKQAVEGFLVGLRGHKATRFLVDSTVERTRVGLDKPVATAVIRPDVGDTVRLSLSRVQEEDRQREYLLRAQGHESTLVEIEPGAIAALDRDPFALRDRSVLTFDRDKVARLVFQRGKDPRIVVERSKPENGVGEDWRVVEPQQGAAKKFKLSSILWSLGSLRATAFLDENPKSWAKWGLDKPEREVVVLDAAGKPLATLAVGGPVPGSDTARYVRGKRPQVLEMEVGRLADLPDSAADLLEAPAP
jgi:hypothetical protein